MLFGIFFQSGTDYSISDENLNDEYKEKWISYFNSIPFGDVSFYKDGNVYFIDIFDLARILNACVYINFKNERLCFNWQVDSIAFLFDKNIVLLGDEIIYTDSSLKFDNESIWVPFNHIKDYITSKKGLNISLDTLEKVLKIETAFLDVEKIEIAYKLGVTKLIIYLKKSLISTLKQINKKEYNLIIFGAKLNPSEIEKIEPGGLIQHISGENKGNDALLSIEVDTSVYNHTVQKLITPPRIVVSFFRKVEEDEKEEEWAYSSQFVGTEIFDEGKEKLEKRIFPIKKIVIDPAHGGNDYGKFNFPDTVFEKDWNLKLAFRLTTALEKLPFQRVSTRSKDIFLSPLQRAKIANKEMGDLFIKIHTNPVKNKIPSVRIITPVFSEFEDIYRIDIAYLDLLSPDRWGLPSIVSLKEAKNAFLSISYEIGKNMIDYFSNKTEIKAKMFSISFEEASLVFMPALIIETDIPLDESPAISRVTMMSSTTNAIVYAINKYSSSNKIMEEE